MQRLQNKRIVLGVTGGIAAYKSAELVRTFIKSGAEVRVVMTPAALEFITPLTLQALSHNPVHLDLLDTEAEAGMGHIELARWADRVVVAPATADLIARLAQGQANDLLSTLCLATNAPICLAPAMNQGMWRNTTTQHNCRVLKERNIVLFGPDEGTQACGDVGPGRMLEPDVIADNVAKTFKTQLLAGVNLMITAGPTQEALDPVRFLSNHSSGKMGYALAAAAAEAGAQVTLVSGPVNQPVPERLRTVTVTTAKQMYDAVHAEVSQQDIFIGCAAVSDYRPETVSDEKIKKATGGDDQIMTLRLVKNPDIIGSVAARNKPPFMVGFAAETNNVLSYAADKLKRKRLNLIVANNIAQAGVGFGVDTNEVTVLGAEFEEKISLSSKSVLSEKLLTIIESHYRAWITK